MKLDKRLIIIILIIAVIMMSTMKKEAVHTPRNPSPEGTYVEYSLSSSYICNHLYGLCDLQNLNGFKDGAWNTWSSFTTGCGAGENLEQIFTESYSNIVSKIPYYWYDIQYADDMSGSITTLSSELPTLCRSGTTIYIKYVYNAQCGIGGTGQISCSSDNINYHLFKTFAPSTEMSSLIWETGMEFRDSVVCNTPADTNCNGCVENQEYSTAKSSWLAFTMDNAIYSPIKSNWLGFTGC